MFTKCSHGWAVCPLFCFWKRPAGALHDITRRCCKSHLSRHMSKYRNIYLSFFLSIYLSISLSVYFCISKKIGRSVRLLHCYMSGGMSALVVCFACLSASFFLLLSVSCSRTWWALLFLVCAFFLNSISAVAGVLLSLCYLMLSLCYLCAISVLSLCYLCYLRWGTVLWSVLSLCYLCAISVLSMLSHARESFLLCAISVLSLYYLC